MTIALIGGAGFVGTRLASVLEGAEIPFAILDKALTGDQHIDITNPDTFRGLPDFNVVINLAAEHRDDVSPKSLYDLVNIEGSKNVCRFCRNRGINTIVFTSTVAVYGFAPEGTKEDGEINYFNDYGRTKYRAEIIYREWYKEDPQRRNLIIIRPTVIFGEGNRGNVYNLLNQIASGRFLMFGGGHNRKSMAYVQNVAEFLHFSTKMTGYHLYNYTDKPDLDMNNMVELIRKTLFNKSGVGIRLPSWLGISVGYGFDLAAACLNRNFSISSIRVKKFMGTTSFDSSVENTGFKPKITLIDGLINTLKYEFLDNNSDKKIYFTE